MVHAEALAANPEGFSEGYRAILGMGAARSAPDLARAYRDLAAMAEAAREALSGYAGLILPTTPDPACAFEETPREVALFTALGNALGLPVTAFPTGLEGGLPLSASALAWDDETALGLAQVMAQDPSKPPATTGVKPSAPAGRSWPASVRPYSHPRRVAGRRRGGLSAVSRMSAAPLGDRQPASASTRRATG